VKHTIVSDKKDKVTVEGKRFKAMCLNDSMAVLTTWANDLSYEDCFSEQLINWVRKGDIVFGFTASGNSKNVLKAFKVAKKHGAISVCFTGGDGGKAKGVADVCLIVPSKFYLYTEDLHMVVVHVLCDVVRSIIQKRK
jgi:D-sedoheptulose 7-phosphate isomerase